MAQLPTRENLKQVAGRMLPPIPVMMAALVLPMVAGIVLAKGVEGAAAPVATAAQTEVGTETSSLTPLADREEILKVRSHDRVMGALNAPLTVIEYASFTCHHCANFATQTFPEIKKNWIDTGKAKFVFRELPFDNLAFGMSALARCVPQDQYHTFVKTLFVRQPDVMKSQNPLEVLSAIGVEAGMSAEQVQACIRNPDTQAPVLLNRSEARQALNVTGTPTFFINGEVVNGAVDYRAFNKALEEAYKKVSQ